MLPFGTVVPMLATSSRPFHDDAYAYEAKLDGVRVLAWVEEGGVRLQNRRLRERTARYPEVVAAVASAARPGAILDGEVVVLREGVPHFPSVLSRENAGLRHLERLRRDLPATYYAFDILVADGRDVRREPLEERRRLLRETLAGDAVRASPFLPGNGREVFRRAVAAGFEGIVAKRRGSPYRAGARSDDWRKVRKVGAVDAVIAGWTPGEGRRAAIGSLVLGLFDEGRLRYVGRVGSGLSDADVASLTPLLLSLERADCPFEGVSAHPARWVAPVLVCHVEFLELTDEGRLRAPAFKGLRRDKPPADCTVAGELAGVA